MITGREKEIIFVNGQNYYPHDLEQITEHIEEIELGKVAFTSVRKENAEEDIIITFVLYKGKLEDFLGIIKSIRREINVQLGMLVEHVIPVHKIPKTTSGKIQRYLLGKVAAGDTSDLGDISTLLDPAIVEEIIGGAL